jgi:hypothetical protein
MCPKHSAESKQSPKVELRLRLSASLFLGLGLAGTFDSLGTFMCYSEYVEYTYE